MSPIKWQCFFHYFPNTHFLLKFTRSSVECFLEIYIVASHSHLYNSNFKICCKLHNFVFFGKENLFTRRERNKTLNIIPFRFNVAGVKKQIKYLFESPWSKLNVHISSQILPVKTQKHNILKKIVPCVVSSNITKQLWNNFQQIQAQTIFPLNESLNVRILSCYFLYAAAVCCILL